MQDRLIEGTTWLTWEQPVFDESTGEVAADRYRFRDAEGYARSLTLSRDAEAPDTLEALLALADPLVFPAPLIQPAEVDPPVEAAPTKTKARDAEPPVSEAPAPVPAAQDEPPAPAQPDDASDAPA